jgi:hypothetical protein
MLFGFVLNSAMVLEHPKLDILRILSYNQLQVKKSTFPALETKAKRKVTNVVYIQIKVENIQTIIPRTKHVCLCVLASRAMNHPLQEEQSECWMDPDSSKDEFHHLDALEPYPVTADVVHED